MLVYATTTDYQAWAGVTAPANIASVLRSASLAVRAATELCFYATDTTGMPTDATIKQAFNDATCCQAAALIAAQIDPNLGATLAASVETATSIGTAHITLSVEDGKNAAAAKQQLVTSLCVDADRILRNAGLVPGAPWVVG